MNFHSPHLLWLLVPLVLLFSWELARHRAQAAANWPKIARAWAGAFDVSLGTQHTTAETRPRLWLWFGLALCIIALARPQWGVVEEQVFDQSREVLIAVDLSKSMLAQDVKPSRLERTKLLITSLLDGLKGERVGLVLFSGTAFLQSPLSADYEILREFLPSLNPDYLPEGGTNYRALLETSIQAFGTSAADRYLIILSDGEATDEDWKPLIEQMKTKGIRVIGLGVGTAVGSFIPDSLGGFVKDDRGAVVLSRLNSSTLQELAQVTGGAYSDASSWVDLAALLRQTVEAGKKGQFSEKNTARLIERFQWFLAPGLLLLFISFWAEFPVRPRERALPLGKARTRNAERGMQSARTAASASLVLALLWLSALGAPPTVAAAETPTTADTLAGPLSTTVVRLSAKDALAAKDCAEFAQTTITYGQRIKSAQQQAPEGVISDALQAVDLGEKLDAQAADWPRLRAELEELRKKQEEEKKKQQDQQKQDQQKQQQQQNQQNQQNQNQDQNQQEQQKQQQSEQQKQDQQTPQQQKQDAFGDMKDQQDKKNPPPPKPQQQTQKVGGQKEKKEEQPLDPDLAMPLQKLDQVRNQDSPAKLQQIMQGQQQKQPKKGKDW
ncbi:MAG: VWA domain-containing protein [Opitutae bacterium]|nr:VWA domain-containing protein [Opitutae bacterium]